jgi:glycine cleavage system H protein
METRSDLYYTKDHEWIKIEDGKATVGITDFAQDQLGSVVFIELPQEDDELAREDVLGAVESVKAASDIYAPVSGKILAVNSPLEDSPELLNEAPYESWLVVMEVADPAELEGLLDEDAYLAFCAEEGS